MRENAPLDSNNLIATDVNTVQAATAPACFLGEFTETAVHRTVLSGEVHNHKQTSIPQAIPSHVDELSDKLLKNGIFVEHDPQVSPFLPISDLADIHGESSSKGDDSWETKLNCIKNSSPEKLTTACQPTNSCTEQVPAATTLSTTSDDAASILHLRNF